MAPVWLLKPTHGPRKAKNAHLFTSWLQKWKTGGYFSFVIHMPVCDEIFLPCNFGTHGLNIRAPGTPKNKNKLCFHNLDLNFWKFSSNMFCIKHVRWYGWENIWEARWAHSDHWRHQAPSPPPHPISHNCTFVPLWPICERLVMRSSFADTLVPLD